MGPSLRPRPFSATATAAALLVTLSLRACLAGGSAAPSVGGATPVVAVTGSLASQLGAVPNVFSTLTSWDPQQWATPCAGGCADLRARYPFLEHVEVFTATGGCYAGFAGCGASDRDLLNDAAVGPASGVNASRLLAPLRSLVAAGLKPHLVTGNVPVSMSAPPFIGGFGFNSAPPASAAAYGAYIEAVARQLVAEFGAAEVASWRWGVFTEYNNADWLRSNVMVYNDIYDFTVCGLAAALGGAASVNVGVHACVQCGKPSWDPLLFLQHAAAGPSACSADGKVRLAFTGNSFYEDAPGMPGDLSWWAPQGVTVLEAARGLGLPTGTYGVDEGRLLFGPEGSAFALTTRAVGAPYQGSWDALFYKLLVASGSPGAYYARWGLSTGFLFAPAAEVVDNVAANLARLAYTQAGGTFVPTTNASLTAPTTRSIVDAVVSSHAGGVLRALLFHHFPLLNASGVADAVAAVTICGLGASAPTGPVAGARLTRLDNGHGTFWAAWRADAAAANISRAGGDYQDGWSEFSDDLALSSPRAHALLSANIVRYQALALLAPAAAAGAEVPVVGADRCVRMNVTLPAHGVALAEFSVPGDMGA